MALSTADQKELDELAEKIVALDQGFHAQFAQNWGDNPKVLEAPKGFKLRLTENAYDNLNEYLEELGCTHAHLISVLLNKMLDHGRNPQTHPCLLYTSPSPRDS